jgi:hypothetical protein
MKLKDVLKVISYLQDVQILVYKENNQDEILYEGNVLEVPWIYVDYVLDLVNGDGEAVFSFINGKNESIIGIYVMEE